MNTLLQINSVANTGSTGRIAEEIGLHAIQNGWNSYIAYGRNRTSSRSTLIQIGSERDVLLHGVQTRLLDRHGLGSRRATEQFIGQIREVKPDIIHLHNLHGYYLNIEVLFKYLAGSMIPVVWTLHDCWPVTGHCAHFDFIGCEKWKSGCHHCPQKKVYPASYLYDRSIKNYHLKKNLFNSVKNLTMVPVCEWLSAIIQQSYLSSFPSVVINNGVDTGIFKPCPHPGLRARLGLQNVFIILGVAGNWSGRKGFGDFLQLANRLPENSKIVLAGLDHRRITSLPESILCIPRTENAAELAEYYSAADIFINPTWEDNFPTTNLESLACGTPVVTYNTGGSIEAVTEQTGFIVEKGDLQGLLDATEQVRSNGKNHYAKSCIDRAKQKYDSRARCQDYLDLYHKLLTCQ